MLYLIASSRTSVLLHDTLSIIFFFDERRLRFFAEFFLLSLVTVFEEVFWLKLGFTESNFFDDLLCLLLLLLI